MREIILNICLVAIATALFKMLVPESGFKKQISFLISCFFITAAVSFITGGNAELEQFGRDFGVIFGKADTSYKITDFSEQTLKEQKRAIGEQVSARVREVLEKADIFPLRIYVIVNISDNYSISINEIKLVLPPDSNLIQASALIEKEVGSDIKVTIEVE